jgi:hypothetical protein
MTSAMASRNGSPVEHMESTGFNYSRDVPNVDEREPLLPLQNAVKRLSRLELLNEAREVAQKNTGLLLIVAGEAFFAIADAIVQTLQKVDPPVTTLQVRLKSKWRWCNVLTVTLTSKLMVIRMTIIYIGCMIYMCAPPLTSLCALCLHPLNRFVAKIPEPFIGPKGVRILLLLRGIGGYPFFINYPFDYTSLTS